MGKSAWWAQALTVLGGVALAVGALDPLEGAPIILGGSALAVAAACLSPAARPARPARLWGLLLIALGVGAMWYVSSLGGFGGPTGRSAWWGVLFVPYFVGWSLTMWGPGAPRWLSGLGLAVGAWHLFLGVVLLLGRGWTPFALVGAGGLVTLVGCTWRLLRRSPAGSRPAPER